MIVGLLIGRGGMIGFQQLKNLSNILEKMTYPLLASLNSKYLDKLYGLFKTIC